MFKGGLTTVNVKDYKHLRIERPAQKDVVITWRRSTANHALYRSQGLRLTPLESWKRHFSVTTDANVDAKWNDIRLKLANTYVFLAL